MCILTQTFAAWLFLCMSTTRFENSACATKTTRFKNKVLFDPALEKHIAQCNQVGCQCKRFRRNYFNWACRLPVDRKDEKRSTWLSFDLSGNAFKWSCTVCDAKGADYANKAGMALYTGSTSKGIQFGHLRHHAGSELHMRNLTGDQSLEHRIAQGVRASWFPPAEVFKDVLRQFKAGAAPNNGYVCGEMMVSKNKAWLVLACLDESFKQMSQEELRSASSITFARDEAHRRLHVRYIACSDALQRSSGFLGQKKDPDPSALGLTRGTVEVLKSFCTRFEFLKSRASLASTAALEFDQELFTHISNCLEAIASDSASNEVTACHDIHTVSALQSRRQLKVYFPMLRWVLRDAAHNARRVISRPWKSDPTLSSLMDVFCFNKRSLPQMIHHSGELSSQYSQCVQEAERWLPISTRFTHLRSAKHRFETGVTVLSRLILGISAMLLFAMKLFVRHAYDELGRAALAFLEAISPESLLQLSMLADAGREALILIREFDNENAAGGVVRLCALVAAYEDRIDFLFGTARGCLQVDGHTAFIITWLETIHHWTAGARHGSVGGVDRRWAQRDEKATMDRCFARMGAFQKLGSAVLRAEFPDFEVTAAMSAFSLPVGAEQCRRMVVGEDRLSKLRRLAHAFARPEDAVISQFREVLPWCIKAWVQGEFGDITSAWDVSINSRPPSVNVADIRFIIVRSGSLLNCTSKVEQSFAKTRLRINSVQRSLHADSENRYVRLHVTDLDPSQLEAAVRKAQLIWHRAMGPAGRMTRQHLAATPRSDKGVRKRTLSEAFKEDLQNKPGKLTETQWHARLRLQMSEAVRHHIVKPHQESQGATPPDPNPDAVGPAWTEGHEKELQFQLQKRRKRLVEAHIANTILPEESNPSLQAEVAAELARRQKSLKDRLSATCKMQERFCARSKLPKPAEFQGVRFSVDPGCDLPSCWQEVLLTRTKNHPPKKKHKQRASENIV